MRKFVWDTSALLNLKEPDTDGYSPAGSFYKDFNDGWIKGPYLNIFPAISFFELSAGISRKHREGHRMLREFYILGENSMVYNIDLEFVRKTADIVTLEGFNLLRGADLIFACIAHLEDAFLVTLDNHFDHVAKYIQVIDLNKSRSSANYRDFFEQQDRESPRGL